MKTAKEFYDFFSAIPEERWTTHAFHVDGKCCAFGHLGRRDGIRGDNPDLGDNFALLLYHENPISINDGFSLKYPQPTPKQRILAALEDAMKQGL